MTIVLAYASQRRWYDSFQDTIFGLGKNAQPSVVQARIYGPRVEDLTLSTAVPNSAIRHRTATSHLVPLIRSWPTFPRSNSSSFYRILEPRGSSPEVNPLVYEILPGLHRTSNVLPWVPEYNTSLGDNL